MKLTRRKDYAQIREEVLERAHLILTKSERNYHKMLSMHEQLKGAKKCRLVEDFLYLVFEIPHYEQKLESFITSCHQDHLDVFVKLKSNL